jgi:hypothetical protein
MSAEEIGDSSHVVLCSATSGSGTSVTYSTTAGEHYQYIKSKESDINLDYGSKITHLPYHKSRISPELKLKQTYTVGDGKMKASDSNKVTEWITDAYFSKTKIYLLVDFWNGSAWTKKSWYDDSRTKVYYLKGVLKNLRIKQKKGRIWTISFVFEEVWA